MKARTVTLTTLAAALLAAGTCGSAAARPHPFVSTGGFERPDAGPTGSRTFRVGRSTANWVATDGLVGVVASSVAPAHAGDQSAVLWGGQTDELTQSLDVPEGVYELTFWARTDCASATVEDRVGVFTDPEDLTSTWTQYQEINETDQQPATLSFTTDEPTCNVYLDSVNVTTG